MSVFSWKTQRLQSLNASRHARRSWRNVSFSAQFRYRWHMELLLQCLMAGTIPLLSNLRQGHEKFLHQRRYLRVGVYHAQSVPATLPTTKHILHDHAHLLMQEMNATRQGHG